VAVDTPAWVRDAIFYQIFPDRFAASARVVKPGPLEPWDSPPTVHGFKGGDLLGVVEHLDHLERLGINAIYFNPIFQSASNHRYHTYDYLAVDPLLGGDAALRELLDAAHARGIRVVLDGVFNHASRGFWPFHHVMETGRSSPYRDWFYLNEVDLEAGRQLRAYPGETLRGPLDVSELTEERLGSRSLETLGYRAWWNLPALPKLNVDNPHLREYLLGVAEHWLDFGIDGWRLDVAEEIEDPFWREFRERVKARNPEAYIVAEIWEERPEYLRGDMYDALMNYPLGSAIISFVGGRHLDMRVIAQQFVLNANVRPEDAATFARRLERNLTAYDPDVLAVQLNLLDSHDTPRLLSVCGGDKASVRLATLLLMTLPGAPSIYYGDEIGLAGEMDPGCRAAFPWDEQAWDRDLLSFFQAATALRQANPVLRHGATETLSAEGSIHTFRRHDDDSSVIVAVNAGEDTRSVEIRVPSLRGRPAIREVLAGSGGSSGTPLPAFDAEGCLSLAVPARDAIVLRVS
jgi:cyclomaltodextrinase / maltogenic alpha-amylase / neopullulanase